MEDLKCSLTQYNQQLSMVNDALRVVQDDSERESLLSLKSELIELIQLTQENMDVMSSTQQASSETPGSSQDVQNGLDNEYALFMQEMADTGAYDTKKTDEVSDCPIDKKKIENEGSDIEDELASLLGMKCAVYHTHKWGGQPSLHNAMVCEVVPHHDDDQFKDLQVRVLFTHPTHTEMLPCPFYLDGDCRFEDEKCRYSHGNLVPLSNLKDAIEPNFESIKVGSRILMKLKPPDGEDTSLTKKISEKYHLWHRAVIKNVDIIEKKCIVKLEHGVKTGEKRKTGSDEIIVEFEEIFPLNVDYNDSSDSDSSLSDTEYPESKTARPDTGTVDRALLIEKSLQNNTPALGEWERHTRGIGSKLMLAMGYVPGRGLGARGAGRVLPVEARAAPAGRSLDQLMAASERDAAKDPLKVEQRLKKMQKKEEERNKRAYEREKERERREKQQFKITEDTKRLEKEIMKLNSSLARQAPGSSSHRSINVQLAEKNRELNTLKSKESQIIKEQRQRKDKQKMTIF
ncbi:hypothetical protein ACJJTC_010043 [Scirpophaga incertulas]